MYTGRTVDWETLKLKPEINNIETKRTVQRNNETKNCFYENINRIDKS